MQNNNRMTNERKAKYKPIDTYKFFSCLVPLIQKEILYNNHSES